MTHVEERLAVRAPLRHGAAGVPDPLGERPAAGRVDDEKGRLLGAARRNAEGIVSAVRRGLMEIDGRVLPDGGGIEEEVVRAALVVADEGLERVRLRGALEIEDAVGAPGQRDEPVVRRLELGKE